MAARNYGDSTRSHTTDTTDATPPRRRHLRRVLPIWLVLASLALGPLATAASVVEASYRFAW